MSEQQTTHQEHKQDQEQQPQAWPPRHRATRTPPTLNLDAMERAAEMIAEAITRACSRQEDQHN